MIDRIERLVWEIRAIEETDGASGMAMPLGGTRWRNAIEAEEGG